MLCIACKKEMGDANSFCPHCGKSFDEQPTTKPQENMVGAFIVLIFSLLMLYILPSIINTVFNGVTSFATKTVAPIINSEEIFKNGVAETIKKDWSSKMNKTCSNVILVKETDHIYRGYAEFSDGSKIKIKVTVDGSQYIYQAELF